MNPRWSLLLAASLTAALGAAVGCEQRPTLRVMAADALAHPFRRVVEDFKREHPEWDVSLETQGSIMLARLAALRPCDVLAVADPRLVQRLLTPARADWVVRFASTELVLAGTEASRYRSELGPGNWAEIVRRPDVRLVLPDPEQDPCGYYTLLCWQLAERRLGLAGLHDELLARCPKERRAWDAAQALSRMQAREGDYCFAYRCHAMDMRMPFTPLPPEINLGDPAREAEYGAVSTTVPDFRGGVEPLAGALVTFGVTVPREAREVAAAQAFVRFLLGPSGRRELEASGLKVLDPPRVEAWGARPAFLEPTPARP